MLSELCEYRDASTNMWTDTVQSTKIKRLPGYAVRLGVCVRATERQKGKKDKVGGGRQTQSECRTEIVMGLITKKWDKHSTESPACTVLQKYSPGTKKGSVHGSKFRPVSVTSKYFRKRPI